MSEEEIKSYIEGFVKQAFELGLSKTQAVEAIMKLANDSSIEYPEDQLVEVH
jgi:hypothetical protein